MFIGHFAIAFVLILLFPQIPAWVPLFGVGFPDLLWGVLVLLRKEEVIISKDSPLQRSIVFKRYPYSHSLILTNVFALAVGAGLAAVTGILVVLPVFVIASASHWILDTVVHLSDLPILGFNGDRKVGLGLWRWGKTAFAVEFVLFALFAVLFVKAPLLLPVVVIGVVFHGINANSFIGFGKKNPFPTPSAYAAVALAGFVALSAIFSYLI